METQTRDERIDDIKARLRECWPGAHGDYSAKNPNGDKFGGYTSLGAVMFGKFTERVFGTYGVWDYDERNLAHFDTPDTLALWIVEAQDRKARLKAEGEDTDDDKTE